MAKDLAPVDPAVASRWVAWGEGPAEARLVPASRRVAAAFSLAERLPPGARAKAKAAAARTVRSPLEITSVHGSVWAGHQDQFLFRPYFREKLETAVFSRIVGSGQVVIDVGANRGWFSMIAASRVGPTGAVLSVEADPRNLPLLRQARDCSSSGARWVVFEGAASDDEGTVVVVQPGMPTLSHLARTSDEVAPEVAHADDGAGTSEVPARPVDALVETYDLGIPDVVKIDVEGAEVLVLSGMPDALAHLPLLLLEVQDEFLARFGHTTADVLDVLGDRFTTLRMCTAHGRLEAVDRPGRHEGRNWLCVPGDRLDDVVRSVQGDVPVA